MGDMKKTGRRIAGILLACTVGMAAPGLPVFAEDMPLNGEGETTCFEESERRFHAGNEEEFTAAIAQANALGGEVEIALTGDFTVSYRAFLSALVNRDGLTLRIASDLPGVTRTVQQIGGSCHIAIEGEGITLAFSDVVLDGMYDREDEDSPTAWGGIAINESKNIVIENAYATRCLGVSAGSSKDSGGPLRVTSSTGVVVRDSVFEKSASLGGGTIGIDRSEVTFTGDTRISENSNLGWGGASGGAVGMLSSTVTVTGNTEIYGNWADNNEPYPGDGDQAQGGAFDLYRDCTLIVEGNAVLRDNWSGLGGAIYAGSSGNYIEIGGRAKLIGNTATTKRYRQVNAMGGAIYMLGDGEIAVKDSAEIRGNKAVTTAETAKQTYGGGIAIASMNARLTVGDSAVIADNEADQGGGIYLQRGTTTATLTGRAKLQDNRAKYGAGLLASGTTHVQIDGDVEIIGNRAQKDGGGLYLNPSATMNVIGGTIAGNRAEGFGGGIFANTYANLTADGTDFSGNQAGAGAFCFNMEDGELLSVYEENMKPRSLSQPFYIDSDEGHMNKAYNNYDIGYEGDCEPLTVVAVEYRAMYGEDEAVRQLVASGSEVTVIENPFAAPEETAFAGWNDTKDGTGTGYEAGEAMLVDGDTTLYAQWQSEDAGGEEAGGEGPGITAPSTATGDTDYTGLAVLALTGAVTAIVIYRRKNQI